MTPKKRSRKAASLSRTVCFLSACALPPENRDVGGRILVIAVPVDGIAPSRKALSTNALAATPGREVVVVAARRGLRVDESLLRFVAAGLLKTTWVRL